MSRGDFTSNMSRLSLTHESFHKAHVNIAMYDLQELGSIMEIGDTGAANGWYTLSADKQAETKFAICYIYITAIKTFYFRVFQHWVINFWFQVKTSAILSYYQTLYSKQIWFIERYFLLDFQKLP